MNRGLANVRQNCGIYGGLGLVHILSIFFVCVCVEVVHTVLVEFWLRK